MVYSTFALSAVTYGSGKHIWDIPTEDVPIGLKVIQFLNSYLIMMWPLFPIPTDQAFGIDYENSNGAPLF